MKPGFSYTILLLIFLNGFTHCSKKGAAANTGGNNPPVNPSTKPYQLVWSDEFDGTGVPDNTKWTYDTGGSGWGNNELEYYTDSRVENARMENGNLIIEARKEIFGGKDYTSARLVTRTKAQWTFGKFEIRAKIPAGTGTWPAIWLLSAHDPLIWPDNGELDIMEEVGFDANKIYGTAHNKMFNGAQGTQKGGSMLIPTAQDSFHIYGIEWTSDHITWSIDSADYFTYTPPDYSVDAWPYNKDFYMILNIAVGGTWGGQQGVVDSIFPQQMQVDYVRVYQRK